MAAQTGRLVRDPNMGVHMNGGTISAKENFARQKKVGAGGRKPLSDLSNSEKPSTQAGGKKALDGSLNSGKQLKPKKLAIVEEVAPAKVNNLESKRTASKVSEKSQTGNRKALSDISNLGKIKIKSWQKLTALTEAPPPLSAIAEEQCLHNHQECIKSHSEDMGLHHFIKTVGLESDSDCQLASEVQAFKLKAEGDLKLLELEEIPEKLPEVESSSIEQFLATRHASPARCMTPKISSCYFKLIETPKIWEDCDVNFKLIETPELSKF